MQIRTLRKRRLMTLEELARRSGVGRVVINRYELGTHKPDIYSAIKIARALDVTVEDLVSDEEIKGDAKNGKDG